MVLARMRKATKAIIILVVVAFVATLIYVGGTLPRGAGGTVAVVNGERISEDEFTDLFLRVVAQQEREGRTIPPAQVEAVQAHLLDQMINTRLLLQGARRERIKVDAREVEARIEHYRKAFPSQAEFEAALKEEGSSLADLRARVRDTLLVEKLLERIQSQVQVTDEDVRDALRRVHIRHILIAIPPGEQGEAEARSKAEAVLARLKAGEDFAALAKEYSEDEATKANGGDLGFLRKNEGLDRDFEAVAFAMKAGEVRGPVKTAFGYHIIKVEEVQEPTPEELAKEKEGLKKALLETRRDQAVEDWLEAQRKKARLVIKDPALAAFFALQQGKLDEALNLYQEALRAEPTNGYLHVSLARIYQEKGEQDKVLQHMEEAARLAPGDASILFTLADLYRQRGKNDRALEYYRKASDLEPDDFYLHMRLLQIYRELKEDRLVAEEIAKLDKIKQANEEARRREQERQKQQGQQEGAARP
ncbi:MAG: peptidylprolyl isomerase [Bacillota bacterium]|nr:peptidylprolyl isomerase [Bacillota bacterium]